MNIHDTMKLKGRVRVWRKNENSGLLLSDHTHGNTATDWARAVLAQLILTSPNSEATVLTKSRPLYIALGTGTGIPSRTDSSMFAEVFGTRKAITYTSAFQAYIAQMTANYQTTDPNGTFMEAGLWDSNVSTTTLNANAAAGATSITVPATAPAVNGSTVSGQYTTIYISDGTNSEYASIAVTTTAGTLTWQLQSGLQYAHNSGVTIMAFTGNLWGHVAFSGAGETKGTGQALVIQWSEYIDA